MGCMVLSRFLSLVNFPLALDHTSNFAPSLSPFLHILVNSERRLLTLLEATKLEYPIAGSWMQKTLYA